MILIKRWFISVNVISAFFLTTSAASGESPGLVAHYSFDEGSGSVVHDTSGNGNDGTIHGATYIKVKNGYALEFDGNDDYIEIPNSESLEIAGDITVAIWINTRYATTGSALAKNGQSNLRQNYIIQLQESGVGFRVVELSDDKKGIGRGALGSRLVVDKWHHVVGTYDGEQVKIYINGELSGAKQYERFEVGTLDAPLFIGTHSYGDKHGAFFAGQLDDVHIYNRAMSQEQIRSQYESGKALRITKLTALMQSVSDFKPTDTTPPTVTKPAPAPDSTVGGNATISAEFDDAGDGIDVSTARVYLDGNEVTTQADITAQGVRFTAAHPLAQGIHRATITVLDQAGNPSNRLSWQFGVDTSVAVEAKIEEGVFLLNGEPHFPMGIYCGSVSPSREKLGYIALAAEAGINYKLEGVIGPDGLDDYLNYGIKALKFIGFAASAYANGNDQQLQDALKTKDHPAMLGWWAEFDSPSQEPIVTPAYQYMKQHDPHHPVIFMHTWAGPHSDVYYVYDYPILNPLRDTNDVVGNALEPAFEAADAEGKDKPVWYITQAFDYRIKAGKIVTLEGGFRPSREEIRAMNYQALTEGVKGLLYYSPGVEIPDTPYCDDVASYPRQWTEVLKIAREVRHLAPELSAGQPAHSVALKEDGEAIHYREISHEGVHTLIAVNTKRELVLAEWEFGQTLQPKVLFENRQLAQKATVMADIFKPLEVHVYQWKQ